MTEREHAHGQSTATEDKQEDDRAPGRVSRSSLMRKLDRSVASGLIQRKERDANGVAAGADDAVAAASSSSGSPLPATLQRKFESSLGADLSSVRVHTGETSAAANEAVGAKAYTVGNDIHFGAGEYDPSSPEGEHLLAHEVAHTVQQNGGAARKAMQFKLAVSSPGDSLEHEADRAADAMVSARPAQVSGGGGVQRVVQREAAAIPATQVTAFVPQLAISPTKQDAILGGTVAHTVKVTNASKADAGTKFKWTWGSENAALDPVAEEVDGPAATLKAKVKRVADVTVDHSLSVTEPGKHVISKVTPAATVHVRQLEPQWIISVTPGEKAKGEPRDISTNPIRVFRTDTVEAVAFFDDVKDLAAVGVKPSSTGSGDSKPDSAVINGNKASFRFTVMKPGVQKLGCGLAVPGLEKTPITHYVPIRAVMTADDTSKMLTEVGFALTAKSSAASGALRKASAAYKAAKDAYDATRNAANAAEELVMSLLVEAFFVGMAGFAGGAVGAEVKHLLKAPLGEGAIAGGITDGVKDLVKLAVKSTAKIGAVVKPPKPVGSLSNAEDPDKRALALADKLDEEVSGCAEFYRGLAHAVWNAKEHDTFDFDENPLDIIDNDVTFKNLASVSTSQQDYARGLWQKWVATYGYIVDHRYSGQEMSSVAYAKDNTHDLFGRLRQGMSDQCGAAQAEAILAKYLPEAKANAEAAALKENTSP